MSPVQMTFVDAGSNQPVVGAHILFRASAYEGTFTGHGGERVNLFLVESITNDAGEIQLAAQDFWPYPFMLNTNYRNPSMIVFKPGYALVTLSNYRLIIAEREDVTTWMYNNQTIRMRRASTNKDTAHSVEWAGNFAEETYRGDKDICSWKKLPQFLVAVDRSVEEWNRKRYTAEEIDLRRIEVRSPLQSLLANEKYYTGKGCESPKLFFDPYLRNTNR